MNVYDFDKTIFVGDSEDRFFDYMFHKKGFFWYRVNYAINEFLFKHKIINKTRSRQSEYRLLAKIPDMHALMREYWDETERYMMDWYLKVKEPSDVIATGTPRFLMEPIMERLGLKNLVATEMDPKTGRITGKFAIGEEKLVAFRRQYDTGDIDTFYSDAYSDHFLADVAKKAYIVLGDGELTEWNAYYQTHEKK